MGKDGRSPNEGMKKAIMALTMVIFAGYMMIWIMMPTNTYYLHWEPSIHSNSNSTYFGQQGGNILIYTFPILFISVLACIYLHLHRKDKSNTSESSLSASWSRPALVKGPLGVISWTELSFAFMFFLLLVWSFSSYLHGMFANITHQYAAQMKEKVWEVKLDSAALMLGLLGNICLAFLFFPVTRGSSILRLVGLTSESSIKYHIWLGHAVITLFTAHGLCYTIFWANTHQISQMFKWEKVGISNVAGEIALLSGLAMWVTSFPRIRRKFFELFFYTHNLYVLFVVFFIFHVGFSYGWITLAGFYLFLIDRYLRFLQSQQKVRLVSARVLPCKAVELNFSKSPGLTYTPTSSIFVNLPSISKLQWHPFTVTSSSNLDPQILSVVIKSEGSWSRKLHEKLSLPSPVSHLEVSVEGPYGPASTHFLMHDTLVMVCGGSGITPYISIIRDLLHIASTTTIKTPKLLLIAAFKKSVDLTMLDLLLPVSGTAHDISHLQLQIQAYITREEEPPTQEEQKQLYHTVWFKPDSSDSPVSAVLGPNNWLWLGAIILSTSVIFLLIIGIFTRYYIYPIDYNTNMIYSNISRSAFYMLFLCMSIILTATTAFLWNKKQNSEEMSRVEITNMPTPTTSAVLGSCLYNTDVELESLPHKSFVQSTTVYYGERPNLQKIISEIEGRSVGVFASGPKKMRQDVATICTSESTKNLHFESISFSW